MNKIEHQYAKPIKHEMPKFGLGRERDILPFLGFKKTTLWKKVALGEFPQPARMGARCTVWNYEHIHQWMNDLWE